MLKNILFLTISLIFLGCSTPTNEFTIQGSIDLNDGNMVYRIIADANQQP